jgi:membrane protease subunit HflK
MAWSPQGGGQGPWGRGPAGPQPPDIEDILRRGQDAFKRIMPGRLGSGRGIALIVIAVAAIWLASGFYRVQPAEQGVVLLFGRWIQTTDPGLNWFFPSPIGTVMTPNVEVINRVEVGLRGADESGRVTSNAIRDVPEESLMLTGDQNIADLDFTVFWKIKDAGEFLFNIRNPEATVKAVAESAMREVVGQTTLEQALTGGRTPVEQKTRTLMQRILDTYGSGISISEVKLLKVDPPGAVIDAFNEVQRARQDKERKQNEAQAYENRVVPTARGEAEKIIQEATAYKERLVLEAEGQAQRFLAVYESYKIAPEVTRQRLYLETMEEVMRGTDKVIIDSGPGGGSGVVPYLPLNELRKRSTGGTNQ